MNYNKFLQTKKHSTGNFGFEPNYFPDIAFDFQKHIIKKAIIKGRMAIFADTGLGKTLMQLSIAKNVINHTNKKVLILTPLAVAFQFIIEAEKIGIDDIEYSKDGKHTKKIVICNYERLHYFDHNDFVGCILDESSILKNFDGKIRNEVNLFIKKIRGYNDAIYRLKEGQNSLAYLENNKKIKNRKAHILSAKQEVERRALQLQNTERLQRFFELRDSEMATNQLQLLIISISKYFKTSETLTAEEVPLLAIRIMHKFGGLTIEDAAVAFRMAQDGDFGKVYERIDSGVIMNWLNNYNDRLIKMRQDIQDQMHSDSKGSSFKSIDEHRKVVPKRLEHLL